MPALIDKAIEGKEVVMARHGRPVAEFRPIHKIDFRAAAAAKVQLRARRDAGKMLPVTAVELLRQIYEDP